MEKNLEMFKKRLEEIDMSILMETYISSNDGDDLISLAKELIKTVEEQQEEIENLKQYKKTLMENSIVRAKAIEDLENEINKLKKYKNSTKFEPDFLDESF